jgi:hypothetical protein
MKHNASIHSMGMNKEILVCRIMLFLEIDETVYEGNKIFVFLDS